MDQPGLPAAELDAALVGLGRINRISGTARQLLARLKPFAQKSEAPLRVLDVASGGGDVARTLVRLARRRGVPMEVEGCDVNADSVARANAMAQRQGLNGACRFFHHDALQSPLPEGYDAIICCLFLHHLTQEETVAVLSKMREAAGKVVLVSDLDRTRRGYLLAAYASQVLSRSKVVHTDAAISARAAHSRAEIRALAAQAGMEDAAIRSQWPQRWLLEWRR